MTSAEDLARRVRRHNWVQAVIAVGMALLSAGLWYASFWMLRLLFFLPTAGWGWEGMWELSRKVAWAGIALLAIEGVRYSRPLFDLADYSKSWYYTPGVRWSLHHGNFWGISYLISQLLFCAPRTTVMSVSALRSLLHPSRLALESAARIYCQLEADRRWVPRSTFIAPPTAIDLLIALHLVWVDDAEGEPQIRFPAGTSAAD